MRGMRYIGTVGIVAVLLAAVAASAADRVVLSELFTQTG